MRCDHCPAVDKAALGRTFSTWNPVDRWACGCRLCSACVRPTCPVCGGATGYPSSGLAVAGAVEGAR